MEPTTFELQIETFSTNDDNWESMDSFWCAFKEGAFRSTESGNCTKWEDDYWHIGKVLKNEPYNCYDVISMGNIFRTEEEALKAIENK